MSDGPRRLYRKVIRIVAEDSPNVKLGLLQRAAGVPPTGEVLIPGVLPYPDYVKRRETWDPIRQCIGLDAQFYEGAEVLLYPPSWLSHSERLADLYAGLEAARSTDARYSKVWLPQDQGRRLPQWPRKAGAVGCDPGEGGANTAFAAADEWGLLDLESRKTPDTSVIPGLLAAFARKHGVRWEQVLLDRGGGGKQLADDMRSRGMSVRTVAFGEAVTADVRAPKTNTAKVGQQESRYAYRNRRAQLYGELRLYMDPRGPTGGWAIPRRFSEVLRPQLSPIPLQYDREGRLTLPPKNQRDRQDTAVTLVELIGYSPDEADAVVLGLHGVLHPAAAQRAGVLDDGDPSTYFPAGVYP
jgi:hypothetical protein